MERDHHFGIQRFGHAQDIGAGHFVGDTARVLAIGTESHVDLVFVTVLRVIVGVVGIAAMVQVAPRRFEQVVHRALIHSVRQYACRFLIRG